MYLHKDLIGDRASAHEKKFIDFWFLKAHKHIHYLVRDGKWTNTRDSCNAGRGDRGSKLKRKGSIQKWGIRVDHRGLPSLIESDVEGHTTCTHWATLLEAAEECLI